MFDTVIRAGSVVDGTGAAARTADIGIKDGAIAEIGRITGPARRTIDADGALVTPGWIDAHTHYDGQVTWDERLEGSAANGVTTVVMGNCGVGFAPVRPGEAEALIDLMEGVEDIPGTALHEGMPWGAWESFEDYLHYLDGRRWTMDVGAQIGHGALRFYVMGERATRDHAATAEDVARMAAIAEGAARAGAVGFSTSRIQGHRSLSGDPVPGTFAAEDELLAIARGLKAGGGGVLQAIGANTTGQLPGLPPEQAPLLDEVAMFARLSRATDQRVVFTTVQIASQPGVWRDVLDATAAENGRGAKLAPMIASRPVTFLASLLAYHPFMRRPTYLRLADLPRAEMLRELRKPEVKAAILAEDNVPTGRPGATENALPGFYAMLLPMMFKMGPGFDYEPTFDQSIGALAAAANRDPVDYFYDYLLEDEGRTVAVFLGSNFVDGNLDVCREMLMDPNSVTGLSDAGAHVRFICDMSMPTYGLTHWVRGRSRGARLPVELVVSKATSVPARLFGFADRGTLEVGKRADVNVIDLDNLRDHMPELHADLPAGGARFLQLSTGYLATLAHGEVTRLNDEDTGARPGRVVRPTR
ncbi:amidohydrolase family protein [Zavarzinia compransoris]|nr:amidohydrolase family protein [Zavarzinia marina]